MAPKPKLVVIHPVHGYKIQPPQDLKTIKRNARERNRVQTVNHGFERLRQIVPSAILDKKMSKVNILAQAVDYIHCLHSMVQQCGGVSSPLPLAQCGGVSAPLPQSPGVSSTSEYSSVNSDSMYTPTGYDSGYTSKTPYADYSPRTAYTPSQYSPYTPHTPYSPQTPYSNSHFSFHNAEMYSQFHSTPNLAKHAPEEDWNSTSNLVKHAQEEDSSEEEDLLDAIAEWQEHSV